MLELRNNEQVQIYVDTLYMLARDAWRAGKLDTFEFIAKGYLAGLVTAKALQDFLNEIDPNFGTNVRAWIKRDPRGEHPDPNVPVPVTPPRGPTPAKADPFKLPSW